MIRKNVPEKVECFRLIVLTVEGTCFFNIGLLAFGKLDEDDDFSTKEKLIFD